MQKNLYYRQVFRRKNVFKEWIFDLFTSLASWPRLILEVFIRSDFGERYFSLATAISLSLGLAVFPFALNFALNYASRYDSLFDVIERYTDWYIFVAAFVAMAFYRQREISRSPSVFDFGKFSLSTGYCFSFLHNIKIFKNKEIPNGPKVGPDSRQIETILEPLMCAFVGLLLAAMGIIPGVLIIICSVCYSLSYMAAYSVGDNFVMDKIDELICNQELYNAFVDGVDPSKTRGVNYYGRRPADPEVRRRVADTFMEEEDEGVDAM